MSSKIPVFLITGYLGSGKTTLLNELLHQDQRKLAVVVNDMGQVNVDARLVLEQGMKSLDTTMVELSNGCICCTLREEFMQEVEELAKIPGLEGIFVEASGISDPASIAQAFLAYEDQTSFYLATIATVVDADRIYREFLEGIETESFSDDDPDIINLVVEQIEFCNCIILNKCDLLTREKLDKVKDAIRSIQPEAEIIETIQSKIDAKRILEGHEFDYDEAMNSSFIQKALKRSAEGETCDDEYGITSFVFEDRRPFDRESLMRFIEEEFPAEIIRSKGYIWFSDDSMHVQLMETAGRNAAVSEFSNWVDAFSEKDKAEVFESYPEVLDEWDPVYGDRMNQLVLIGKGYDKEEVKKKLNECLSKEKREKW